MIEVEHLSKKYGELLAVQDLSFSVKKGQIWGLLGPNAAGKTTTMRIITGYLSATDGKATVAGYDVFEQPNEVKKIQKMILSTDLDREPKTHIEKILCDADLDNLGREDFFKLDGRLREGRRARGVDVSDDIKWFRGTLEIITKHKYYTQSQKKLREKGKQKNIKRLLNKLENIEKKKQGRI